MIYIYTNNNIRLYTHVQRQSVIRVLSLPCFLWSYRDSPVIVPRNALFKARDFSRLSGSHTLRHDVFVQQKSHFCCFLKQHKPIVCKFTSCPPVVWINADLSLNTLFYTAQCTFVLVNFPYLRSAVTCICRLSKWFAVLLWIKINFMIHSGTYTSGDQPNMGLLLSCKFGRVWSVTWHGTWGYHWFSQGFVVCWHQAIAWNNVNSLWSVQKYAQCHFQ